MRMCKRMVCVLLAAVMVVTMLSVCAFAAVFADEKTSVRLTVCYQNGDTPLIGAAFDVYRIATADEDGAWTMIEELTDFEEMFRKADDSILPALATTFEGYLLLDEVAPAASAVTDANGTVTFEALEQGAYLLVGQRHIQGGVRYDTDPLLVFLPSFDDTAECYVYDVTVYPKTESAPAEENATVKRKVLKVWEDQGARNVRPVEITVHLLRDGDVYDTVTVSAEEEWRYTWENLDADYDWVIVEDRITRYVPIGTWEGLTYLLKNYYARPSHDAGEGENPDGTPDDEDTEDAPGKPTTTTTSEDGTDATTASESSHTTVTTLPEQTAATTATSSGEKLPQTGQLWWPVPILFVAGLLLVAAGLICRKGGRCEE